MTDSVDYTVHVEGLSKFAADLKRASADLRKDWDKSLAKAGDAIAAAGRSNAGWSATIPSTIKVVKRRGGVAVRAGGARARHAAPFDRGSDGNGGTLRHPVFGQDVWVEEPGRPLLNGEIEKHDSQIEQALLDAWDHINI